jgi:hypothetical protein
MRDARLPAGTWIDSEEVVEIPLFASYGGGRFPKSVVMRTARCGIFSIEQLQAQVTGAAEQLRNGAQSCV